MPEDKATQRARMRKEFREEIIRSTAEGQVKIARERGRQRVRVEKSRTNQRVRERNESEAARVSAYQARSDIAIKQREQQSVQRVQTQGDLAALNRRQRVINQGTGAVTHSSFAGTLSLLAVLFFVMIFLYVIVHNGAAFGTLTGSVGTFIQGLSSNTPLFVKTSKA